MISTTSTLLRKAATRASVVRWQHHRLVIQRPQHSRWFSTAPKPATSSAVGIGMSYEEWAASKRNEMQQTKQQPRKQRQRVAPQQQLDQNAMNPMFNRRISPQKYNSLVMFPEHVSLKWSADTDSSQVKNFQLNCENVGISKPSNKGGAHVLLGRNGSGKSLLVDHITNAEWMKNGFSSSDWKLPPTEHDIAYVSFESHLETLRKFPYMTVHNHITGGDGNLSPTAKYLVVRFGLKSLLSRKLSTLSTGEIRKCMIVAALAKSPQLLILENAFDGLDAKSRQELQSIIQKSLQGLSKSGKLLVQAVMNDAEYIPPTQILISTHQPSEILPEISTVSWINDHENEKKANDFATSNDLITIHRPTAYSPEQLMFASLGLDKDHNKCNNTWSILPSWQENDPRLPTESEVRQVWDTKSEADTTPEDGSLFTMEDIEIQRLRDGANIGIKEADDPSSSIQTNKEYVTLLHSLDWDIQRGQRWIVAGGNGAGKSTLTRFLVNASIPVNDASEEKSKETRHDVDYDTTHDIVSKGNFIKNPRATVGWVSTESHVGQVLEYSDGQDHQASTTISSAWDLICHDGTIDEDIARTVVKWVFGGEEGDMDMLQSLPFAKLSQGQQKLVLIAQALTLRPNLLILDEPLQGLDWINRRRILALLERLCDALPEDLSLVYITHHPKEELIPSITHVLELESGHTTYQGSQNEYSENAYRQ